MSTPQQPQQPGGPTPGQPGPDQPGQAQPYPAAGQPAPGQPAGQPVDQPQYGQQGGKYGTTGYDPTQYTGAMGRPAVFDRLLKLTMISLGLYLLNGIIGIIANSVTDFAQVYRDMGFSTAQAEQMSGGFMSSPILGVISLIIGVALYLLVYSGLKKAKNWARILGTVLAAIAILSSLFSLFGVAMYGVLGIVMAVVTVIKIVVDILWIVTAFRAPNSAYFKQNVRA